MAADEPRTDLSPEQMAAMQRKLDEGFACAEATAARRNYNLTHDVEIDQRLQSLNSQPGQEPPKTFEDAFLSRLRQYAQWLADRDL